MPRYAAIVWVIETSYLVRKSGMETHHLGRAKDYATKISKYMQAQAANGFVTITDLETGKELERTDFEKALRAAA